jgi:hypothetical protein
VQVEFKADRKEPLGDLVRRVAALFSSSGLEPSIEASFSDGPAGLRSTSAVERAIKKHPHLGALERNDSPRLQANLPTIRRLTNVDSTSPFPLDDIIALADGVPRSLPFHAVQVGFGHADLGAVVFPFGLAPRAGISVSDGWWVNGRLRSLTAFYSVEARRPRRNADLPAAVAQSSRASASCERPRSSSRRKRSRPRARRADSSRRVARHAHSGEFYRKT